MSHADIDIGIVRCRGSSVRAELPVGRTRIRAVLLVVLVGLVLAVAGCSSGGGAGDAGQTTSGLTVPTAQAGPAVRSRPVTVVVLGSSSAAGFGLADPADGWVSRYTAALVAADPADKVVNLAVMGFSTFQVRPTGSPTIDGRPAVDPEHNVTAALALDPDAVIVNLPSNDAALGVSTDALMANLAAVTDAARAKGVPVWVGTTQPRNLDDAGRALLVEARDRILATYGDRAVELWTGIAAPDGTIDPALDSGDGVHLNARGHEILVGRFIAADIPAAVAQA